MRLIKIATLITATLLSYSANAGTGNALIGWQTFDVFDPAAASPNETGISDVTPDTNSTYDTTPSGNISASNHYLTGAIGPEASGQGYKGLGQATNNDFLNGANFGGGTAGNGELIENWPLADGSPGQRIGPFGGAGTSSWKFADTNNQLRGDFSITNNSSYYFRLEFIHYDARSLATATAPTELKVKYLATPGNLTRFDNGNEVTDLQDMNTTTWTAQATENISRGLGGATNTQVYLAPGDKAAFRFIWSGNTGAGQAQIDNIAFEGTFFETAALQNVIDPSTLPPSINVPTLPLVFQLVFAGVLALISLKFFSSKRANNV